MTHVQEVSLSNLEEHDLDEVSVWAAQLPTSKHVATTRAALNLMEAESSEYVRLAALSIVRIILSSRRFSDVEDATETLEDAGHKLIDIIKSTSSNDVQYSAMRCLVPLVRHVQKRASLVLLLEIWKIFYVLEQAATYPHTKSFAKRQMSREGRIYKALNERLMAGWQEVWLANEDKLAEVQFLRERVSSRLENYQKAVSSSASESDTRVGLTRALRAFLLAPLFHDGGALVWRERDAYDMFWRRLRHQIPPDRPELLMFALSAFSEPWPSLEPYHQLLRDVLAALPDTSDNAKAHTG